MSGHRRSSSPDSRQAAHDRLEERLAGKVKDSVDALAERSEASFKVVIEAVGSLQKDIRLGQIDRAAILGRLGELEIAVGENRDATNNLRARVTEVEAASKDKTKAAVVEAAPEAAATATRAAPKELWTSLSGFQKVMAIAAACVAILAGLSGAMTGFERLVRGGVEGARVAWSHTKGDEASTRKAAD